MLLDSLNGQHNPNRVCDKIKPILNTKSVIQHTVVAVQQQSDCTSCGYHAISNGQILIDFICRQQAGKRSEALQLIQSEYVGSRGRDLVEEAVCGLQKILCNH